MKSNLIRYGGPAAGLDGALCIATFGMVYLIYDLFREQAKTTFFGDGGFVYIFYAPMYVLLLLLLRTAGVYLRQRSYFGLVGKAGFYLTALEFSLGAIGNATIMSIAGDEVTVSVLTSSRTRSLTSSTLWARSCWASPPTGRASCRKGRWS